MPLPNSQKGFAPIIILPLVLLLLFLLGGAYYAYQSNQVKEESAEQRILPVASINSPQSDKGSSDSSVVLKSTVQTFTSSDLGISFNYLNRVSINTIDTVKTKVVDNKVYVYFKEENFEKGQYVEVFNKESKDDLKTAIEKQILKNYSKQNCSIDISKSNSSYPETYEVAYISYSKDLLGDGFVGTNDVDKCPTKYISYQGKAIFVTDKKHPNKFVFFSIGQYGIEAGDGKFWEETIKFLN